MAAETGGRLTLNTNDFTMGWARARRDLSCRYTLGFYDRSGREGRPRRIRASVLRPGVRVVHPESYRLRSPEERRASMARAAFAAPGMFDNGLVRAHLFPLEPVGRREWRCLLAVDFPVRLPEQADATSEHEFGLILRGGKKVVRTLGRKITLRTTVEGAEGRRVSFSEPVELRPGEYTLSVVLGSTGEDVPSAASVQLAVPEIPRKEIFLTESVLGRRAGGNVVIHGAGGKRKSDREADRDRLGTATSFMPLLVRRVASDEPVVALTQACLVGQRREPRSETATRQLAFEDGRLAGTLEPVAVTFDQGGPIECRSLVDILPVADLPDGHYLFRAALESAGQEVPSSSVPLRVTSRSAGASDTDDSAD